MLRFHCATTNPSSLEYVARVTMVTDSSACLPAELVAVLDIKVLAISVHLPDGRSPGTLAAGAKAPIDYDMTETIAELELNAANHPFVTEYLEAIEGSGSQSAIVVTPAVEFAAMYRNASLAASLAACPAIAFDARTAAAGQALVVLAGAEAAQGGADLETVAKVVEDASRRVELVASLATLEPIRRSGPVPSEVLGDNEADLRSVFRMREGEIEPLGSAQTTDEALKVIASAFNKASAGGIERVVVFHADAPQLAKRLTDLLGGVDFVSGFSPAMQVHTGPGVVGAAWIPKAFGI